MQEPLNKKLASDKARLHRLSLAAMHLALALVFAAVEAQIPPPPLPFPVRYGLSNIPLMLAFLSLGPLPAFAIVLLKALIAFLSRGPMAGSLSLAGGCLSFLLLFLLLQRKKRRSSLLLLSVASSLAHMLGQFLLLFLLFEGLSFRAFLGFLSPLLLFGLITGIISGLALGLVMKTLPKLGP